MKPVVIRYYGLVALNKRTYLILQGVVFTVLLAALVWVLTLPPSPRFGWDANRLNPISVWILDHLLLIVLVTALLEVLDTIFTLRAFARKERQQLSAAAEGE